MSGKRAALMRYFRSAASVLCGLSCAILLFFWVRSYSSADRLHWPIWGKKSVVIASKEGRLILVSYESDPAPNEWKTGVYSFSVDDDQAFPRGSVRIHEWLAGFGLIRQPTYFVPEWKKERLDIRPGYWQIWSAMNKTLKGSGVVIPFWFAMLMTLAVLTLVWTRRPWRYSTRTLLIAMTAVAILLGLIAVLDNGAAQ
jgi:hypothetical protein